MLSDLVRRARERLTAPPAFTNPHDDFCDTEPSLFWVDSQPPPADVRPVALPHPATMPAC